MIDRENVSKLSGPELVAAYNQLNPEKQVKRFASRTDGIKRVLASLGETPAPAAAPEPPASPESNTAAQPAPAPAIVEDAASEPPKKAKRPAKRPPATTFKANGGDANAPRPKSKRAQLLAMLQRPEGVTQEAAERKFEWQPQDFKDCLRLLAKKHGIATKCGDDGKWRVA